MDGFLLAKAITKKHAKAFYFASRFLEKEKRNAAYAVYAICRLSDESVDSSAGTLAESALEKLEKNITAVYSRAPLDNPLLLALRQSVEKYQIPQEYFGHLLAGMYLDLRKNRYRDFAELSDYCYKVAGVVGLIMLQIFGYNDPVAKGYAVDLGIAMQLTNILRDIKEDYERGRIYLTEDEMCRFGVKEQDIREGRLNENFRALLKFQIARAHQYYSRSRAGIKMISNRNSRFVVYAMAEIYAGILKAIEKNHYDIFSRRAQVSAAGKISTLLKIILEGKYR